MLYPRPRLWRGYRGGAKEEEEFLYSCNLSPLKEPNPWQNQKKCGSARQQTAVISTILTEGTGRERYPKEPVLKICMRIGSVQFAEQARKCSGPWLGLGLWRLRPSRVERPRPGQVSQRMRIRLDMPCAVNRLGIIPINLRPGFFEL